ncbi:MAG: lipid IV(A) 3-deoxy-D-manno-octulosonic acid transferase [Candidatus Symbiodolus clandestinus]
MRWLYTLIFYLIQPLVLLRLLWRSKNLPNYRQRWLERYGIIRHPVPSGGIMIHCTSVGEIRAAIPLIRALSECYPDLAITVTTLTVTGSAQVQSLLGSSVYHSYLPYDLPGAVNRFIDHHRPRLVILLEKELWPNLLHTLSQQKIPVILVNACLSLRSLTRYQRWCNRLIRQMVQQLTHVVTPDTATAERFITLGLPATAVTILGNLKQAVMLSPILLAQAAALKQAWADGRLVWIAGSTHAGEEEAVLAAHQQLLNTLPALLLIIVPRHPERFDEVARLIQHYQLTFLRRSSGQQLTTDTQVLLVDILGELLLLYGVADVAFVGGSLLPHGGHNPLEPAAHGLPILMGSHNYNCQAVCQQLQQMGGLTIIQQPTDLPSQLLPLLLNPQQRYQQGQQARQLLSSSSEILKPLLQLLNPYCQPPLPPGTIKEI